jgi:predicted RND superfamily exporter protein
MGRRAVETTIALTLALLIDLRFALHHTFSLTVLVGFSLGIIAPYLMRLVGMPITTESLLMIILSIGVGSHYGIAAFGMEMVGYLVFNILKAVVIAGSSQLFFRRQS